MVELSQDELKARKAMRLTIARVLWRHDMGEQMPEEDLEREALFQLTKNEYMSRAQELDKILNARGYNVIKIDR